MKNHEIIKLLPASFDLGPEHFTKYEPKRQSTDKKVETKTHVKQNPETFNWDEDDCQPDGDLWARYYGYM